MVARPSRGSLGAAALAAASFVASAGECRAGPALLFESNTGRVLYAEDAGQPWYPASLTKMMTAYVVFDAYKKGEVKPTDKVKISARANARPKMRLGLGAGKEITYEEAVNALIMKSANDIASAIAENVSGTEEIFVARMNATAVRLGMYGTRFINPHGLPGPDQHTTAKDLARLTLALQRDYPEHAHIFAMRSAQVGKRAIATHNPALVSFEGGDGMKTGFTCSAGYNIVASATRGSNRIVAVVLGEKDKVKRAQRMAALVEYGFRTVAWKAAMPAPTVESVTEGNWDRLKVREANLVQRLKDCTGPDEEDELVASVDDKPAVALAEAIDKVVVSAPAGGKIIAVTKPTATQVSTAPTPAAAGPASVVLTKAPAATEVPPAKIAVPAPKAPATPPAATKADPKAEEAAAAEARKAAARRKAVQQRRKKQNDGDFFSLF